MKDIFCITLSTCLRINQILYYVVQQKKTFLGRTKLSAREAHGTSEVSEVGVLILIGATTKKSTLT
jgi:hypothetical protein